MSFPVEGFLYEAKKHDGEAAQNWAMYRLIGGL
jgi:hypothetical protein